MRAGVLSAVLLSLAVAGCIGGPAETTDQPDWPKITDPQDLSYNTSTGFHIHDYWGGSDQVPVVDGTIYNSWNSVSTGSGEARDVQRFRPQDGDVVPQGTANLSITVSWSDRVPAGNSYGDMELWVKPANSDEASLVHDDLENGETIDVPILYEEADLPHQTISAWEFQVHIRGSTDPLINNFQGEIHLRAVAHRGLELQPFPPHPDHWGNRSQIALVEDTRRFTQFNHPHEFYSGRDTYSFGSPEQIRPTNGTIVPVRTDRVEVELTWDRDVPVGGLDLYYHAADTLDFTLLEPDEQDQGTARYLIPVNGTTADSPYSNSSLWEFVVKAPEAYQHDAPYVSGDVPVFFGEFTLNATVRKARPSADGNVIP